MVDVDAALQSQIRNIEATYGQPLSHWFAIIDDSGLTKHNQVVAMLKSEHGLAHGAAHRVSLLARDRSSTISGTTEGRAVPPDVVDALYAGRTAGLRPLHDRLMSAIDALGEVEIAPKKGYISLRRRKQFAMIQPSAAGRIDLGLILPPGTPATDRLEAAGSWNALFTHRVRVTSLDDIDDELCAWVRDAYATAV
jgi:hypothetical protein